MKVAAKALTMKSYCSMAMLARRGIAAGDHELPSLDMDDVHRRAVEPRQALGGDDLVHAPQDGLRAAKIEHAVDLAQERREFVRAEQHGHAELALDLPHQADDGRLIIGIEPRQRLVEKQ